MAGTSRLDDFPVNWFESLTGFGEGPPEQVRAGFVLHEDALVSRANGRRLVFGRLETPSLAQLRERAGAHTSTPAGNTWREVFGDARALHPAGGLDLALVRRPASRS